MEPYILVVIALSFLGLVFWVGMFVFNVLNIMRSDPREIEFRKDLGHTMGLVPKDIEKKDLEN